MITRRRLIGGLAVTGAGRALGVGARPAAAEPAPETKRIRLIWAGSLCQAPLYVAEGLLRAEGFTDVQYLTRDGIREVETALARGEADVSMHFAAPLAVRLEQGDPIVIVAGGHVGCFELFGNDRVRAIRDLKGKTVAVPDLQTGPILFVSTMAAHVGLNPRADITWVRHPRAEAMQLLAEGKIDAYLGFPPDPQELRAKRIGHVVVNSAADRPWSQYFCCLIVAHREFVRKHPVAVKRAVRAILKGADVCAAVPQQAARSLVDRGYAPQYDYALQLMKELPYGRWREYNPEDTIRFYALRLREAGLIKESPQAIIARGTDWRFLDELKQELKR